MATQIVARDRHAELFDALALLGTAIEQLALERAPLAAHRGRRGGGGVRQGPEGLVGDAAQEEPDPVARTCAGSRACCAATRSAGARERRAVARARHLALVGRARDRRPTRPVLADFMVARAPPALVDGPRRQRATRMRANLELTGGLFFTEARAARARAHRAAAPGGVRDGAALGLRVARAAGRAGRRREGFRALLAEDPDVAARADAGASSTPAFDLEHHLRHAGASSIARLRDEDETPHDRRHRCPRAAHASTLDEHRLPDARRASTRARSATATRRDAASASIVVTDRLSAFDVVLGTIPFKGQVLNQLAAFWFEATRRPRAQPRHRRARPDGDGRRASASRCRSRS